MFRIKNLLLLTMMFLVLIALSKPYHTHNLVTVIESNHTHHETEDISHNHEAQHDHSKECESECGSDCACPFHRMSGCSPMTVLTKTDRIDLLDLISINGPESIFLAKTSPVLDGPFRPPLS